MTCLKTLIHLACLLMPPGFLGGGLLGCRRVRPHANQSGPRIVEEGIEERFGLGLDVSLMPWLGLIKLNALLSPRV